MTPVVFDCGGFREQRDVVEHRGDVVEQREQAECHEAIVLRSTLMWHRTGDMRPYSGMKTAGGGEACGHDAHRVSPAVIDASARR